MAITPVPADCDSDIAPMGCKHLSGFCYAGILTSAVLAVNVVVNYQQKLSDFLVDLASETRHAGSAVQKVE